MNRFVDMLSKEIILPEEMAPGYRLFLRGKHLHKLNELQESIEHDVWYV